VVLDIANTGVARGRIYLAGQEGRRIPEGWAMTAEGVPTTDPEEAIRGVVLPMAGHKGYAIAVMMNMLSGVLTGGTFGADVRGPYQAQRRRSPHDRAGHRGLPAPAEFEARTERLIAGLKSVPPAPGFDEVLYPGEPEARNDARNRCLGLRLPADTLADLARLADETGLRSRLPF
jgi:LDH2 family malate/lactate/ureidoglycolate dehydrogenase